VSAFHLSESTAAVLKLMQKYADVPMSFADACLVRMTETLGRSDPPHHRHRFQHLPATQPPDCPLRDACVDGAIARHRTGSQGTAGLRPEGAGMKMVSLAATGISEM